MWFICWFAFALCIENKKKREFESHRIPLTWKQLIFLCESKIRVFQSSDALKENGHLMGKWLHYYRQVKKCNDWHTLKSVNCVQMIQTWQTLNKKYPKRQKHVTMHLKCCCGLIKERTNISGICVWCSANIHHKSFIHFNGATLNKECVPLYMLNVLCYVLVASLNQTNKNSIIICVCHVYFAISLLFETLFHFLLQYPNWIFFVKTMNKVLLHSMHVNRRNRYMFIGIHGAGHYQQIKYSIQ